MTTTGWVILVVAVVVVIILGFIAWRNSRTKNLRSRFGPEYDHMVQERGSASRAEKELEYRAKRVEKFQLRPLSKEERGEFGAAWRNAQQRFVDDPRGAVAEADHLVQAAMRARGYPTGGDFEERVADLSVDHATVVDNYRAAHEIAIRDSRGQVSTEDLRAAMKHYRALFEDLLDERVVEYQEVRR